MLVRSQSENQSKQNASSWSFVSKDVAGQWNWFIKESSIKNWQANKLKPKHNTCLFIGDANGISPTTLSLARYGFPSLSHSPSPTLIINILWVWINFKTFRQLARSNLTFRCHLSYLVWHISHSSSCCRKLFILSSSLSLSLSTSLSLEHFISYAN